VRDSLFLRGMVIEDERGKDSRILIAALDYCVLAHSAYEQLCDVLADASGTSRKRVVIHCVHQHEAPALNFEAMRYQPQYNPTDYQWWPQLLAHCEEQVRKTDQFQEAQYVGFAETKVDKFASNRRVKGNDGVIHTRWSCCANLKVRSAPEGLIDPMLRTIAFKNNQDEIIAGMSFYACHPQAGTSGEKFSAEAPGNALERLSRRSKNGFQMYLTGAAGNITAGKYSLPDNPEKNVSVLGERLYNAIKRNMRNLQWEAAVNLEWSEVSFKFPFRKFDRDKLHEQLNKDPYEVIAAAQLSTLDCGIEQDYRICMLKIGSSSIVFLPGEVFVEYQLFANSQAKAAGNNFVAVAANCRWDFMYLPLAKNFSEKGGYETLSTLCDERIESLIKDSIRSLFHINIKKSEILSTQ